jgi:hypothetical protein
LSRGKTVNKSRYSDIRDFVSNILKEKVNSLHESERNFQRGRICKSYLEMQEMRIFIFGINVFLWVYQ